MSNIDFTALLPEGWERPRGYSQGVRSSGSRIVHIAGQIGAGHSAENNDSNAGGFGAQFERALGRVVAVMASAGGGAENITAMRMYVTDLAAYNDAGADIAAAWKNHMGKHFPAITLVGVSGLISAEALVEIEAEGTLP